MTLAIVSEGCESLCQLRVAELECGVERVRIHVCGVQDMNLDESSGEGVSESLALRELISLEFEFPSQSSLDDVSDPCYYLIQFGEDEERNEVGFLGEAEAC